MIGLARVIRTVALSAGLLAGMGSVMAQQAPAAPAAPSPEADIKAILAAPVVPTHLDVARQVLIASGLRTMFVNSTPNVVGALRVNFTRMRPELTRDIEASLKAVEEATDKFVNDGLDGAARFMAVRLTEVELKEVLAFMTSPTGKKYVEALPGFMDLVLPYLQIWTQEVNERMTGVFQQEMLKRGHKF
jgi:hypothetical protein